MLAIVGVFLVFMAMIIVRGFSQNRPMNLSASGKWLARRTASVLRDGTVRLTKGGGELYAKWKRQDDGRLKIEGRTLGSSWGEEYEVAIDGDNLTLKKVDGVEAKYKRVAVWRRGTS